MPRKKNIPDDLPTFLPLAEAADRYGLSVTALTKLVQTGTIGAAQSQYGELLVNETDVQAEKDKRDTIPTKDEAIEERWPELRGQGITISQAVEKYDVPNQTIRDWVNRNWINIVEDKYPVEINEAEVAYCADIYHRRKESGIGVYGAPLLDEEGREYQLKNEWLAKHRQKKRRRWKSAANSF